MFDTLLLLPLFQGLAQEDFTKILGKVKLHFTKHKKREVIAAKGSPCRELIFVLKGEVSVTSASDAPAYSLTETLPAPWVIEPQSLFGMQTAYAADYGFILRYPKGEEAEAITEITYEDAMTAWKDTVKLHGQIITRAGVEAFWQSNGMTALGMPGIRLVV